MYTRITEVIIRGSPIPTTKRKYIFFTIVNVSPEISNNFVAANMEVSIQKINTSLWLCYMKKKITIILKIKEETRHRRQTNFGT